jgi:hypothetical protein
VAPKFFLKNFEPLSLEKYVDILRKFGNIYAKDLSLLGSTLFENAMPNFFNNFGKIRLISEKYQKQKISYGLISAASLPMDSET